MKSLHMLSVPLLIALVGFPQISETIYTPALPNVAAGLDASASIIEASLAIYFLGFALGVLVWGTISDYSGRRYAMLAGLLIYALGTLLCATVESAEALLVWRFLQAFGASVGSVITQTILRDAFEGAERIKLFSVMSGALAFSPAVGPLLGGFISEFLGWRANFWFLLIAAVFLFLWTFFSLKETRPKQVVKFSKVQLMSLSRSMLASRSLWGHILLIGGTNSILFGFYQEAPFIFIEHLGMSPSHYGFFGMLIAAATVLAARVSYQCSGHLSANSIIKMGSKCVLGGGTFLTAIVASGIFSLEISGMALVVSALFLTFFGVGLIIPNSLSHALKEYQSMAGTAGSLFGGFYYCIIAGCTWLMSLFHNGLALPLPLYITLLGLLIACGSQLIQRADPVAAGKQIS